MSESRPELSGDTLSASGTTDEALPVEDPVGRLLQSTRAVVARFPELAPMIGAVSETAGIIAQAERAASDPRMPRAVAEVLMAGVISKPETVSEQMPGPQVVEGAPEESQSVPLAQAIGEQTLEAAPLAAEVPEAPTIPSEQLPEPSDSIEEVLPEARIEQGEEASLPSPAAETDKVDLAALVEEMRQENPNVGTSELLGRLVMAADRLVWPAEAAELILGSAGKAEINEIMVAANRIVNGKNVKTNKLLSDAGRKLIYVEGINPMTGRKASAYKVVLLDK